MRLSYLPNLFNFKRLARLKEDFSQPYRALLASSGLISSPFTLQVKDGSLLEVSGHDRTLWQNYFDPPQCEVVIKGGKFFVTPQDRNIPPYSIAPGHNGLTFDPQRWNDKALTIPIVKHLQQAERQVFSQHGEDGAIEELLKHIPSQHNFLVEFGAHDGINMSNSRYLIKDRNWSAYLIEADKRFFSTLQTLYHGHPRVKIQQTFITPENINDLFRQVGVPYDFEIMSVDIDSIDYYVWEALTDFAPKIVIVEYNSSVPPDTEYIVDRDDAFSLGATAKEGASLLAYENLAKRKGYQLIYTELSGSNAFFIHESCKQYFKNVDWSQLTTETLYQAPQFGVLAGSDAANGRGYPDRL